MKGENVYKCKGLCKLLCDCCHNTKNRVIEKMCVCERKDCGLLGDYLQCLMVTECLCNYICLCACEQESISSSILSELNQKCSSLISIVEKLLKVLDKKHCDYLRCNEIKKMCSNCKVLKSGTSRTKKRKASRRRNR